MSSPVKHVAVIGAGLSGLVCAQALHAAGLSVLCLDMGTRGPGGRASTRRHGGDLQFDHGLQFIGEPQAAAARTILDRLKSQGAVRDWTDKFATYSGRTKELSAVRAASAGNPTADKGFCNMSANSGALMCGYPSTDAICRALHENSGFATRWGCKADSLAWDGGRQVWSLTGLERASAASAPVKHDLGEFEAVVIADSMPLRRGSPGSIDMDAAGLTNLRMAYEANVVTSPTIALMMCFSRPLPLAFDAYSVSDSPLLTWLARDSSKPGRERKDGSETWVALTTPEYARSVQRATSPAGGGAQHVPQTAEFLDNVKSRLLGEVMDFVSDLAGGNGCSQPTTALVHRWGSAFHEKPLGTSCLVDEGKRVVACGDFCTGSSFEGAVVSGLAAAEKVSEWSRAHAQPAAAL